MPTENEIKARLRVMGYPERRIEGVTQKLTQLQPQLQEPFERWFETGELPKLEVEGFNADRLIGNMGMNPAAVFLSLDWLLREPALAKGHLDRGHDYVYFVHIPEEVED